LTVIYISLRIVVILMIQSINMPKST